MRRAKSGSWDRPFIPIFSPTISRMVSPGAFVGVAVQDMKDRKNYADVAWFKYEERDAK
ncbi:MAG: hypothetical protein ACLR2E_13395 [Lachnospiraceae bacterium]